MGDQIQENSLPTQCSNFNYFEIIEDILYGYFKVILVVLLLNPNINSNNCVKTNLVKYFIFDFKMKYYR